MSICDTLIYAQKVYLPSSFTKCNENYGLPDFVTDYQIGHLGTNPSGLPEILPKIDPWYPTNWDSSECLSTHRQNMWSKNVTSYKAVTDVFFLQNEGNYHSIVVLLAIIMYTLIEHNILFEDISSPCCTQVGKTHSNVPVEFTIIIIIPFLHPIRPGPCKIGCSRSIDVKFQLILINHTGLETNWNYPLACRASDLENLLALLNSTSPDFS